MKKLKREKLILSTAILAPLLLIGYFLLTPLLDFSDVEDPQYNILISARAIGEEGPYGIENYSFHMHNGKLKVLAHKSKSEFEESDDLHIFIYSPKANKLIPIPFDATHVKRKAGENSWVINIPELETLTLSLKRLSSDGYLYTRQTKSGMVLFGLFDSPTPAHVLKKDNHTIMIPIDRTRYNNIRFRGWITDVEKQP